MTPADLFAQSGTDVVHAGLYSDGIVLYLALSQPSVKQFAEQFASINVIPETYRSEDGFCSALVLRGPPEFLAFNASVLSETCGEGELIFTDNRPQPIESLLLLKAFDTLEDDQ